MNFQEFKTEILTRAKRASACEGQYKLAYKSESFAELFDVIKNNFNYAVNNEIIDCGMIESVKEDARLCEVFVNESVTKGYLLAWGNATVEAGGNATVEAGGNATVEAWGNATVKAWDNATVEAWGNATVEAGDNATVKAWDNATVEAGGNATVEAGGNATVKAWGNAFISSYKNIECKLSDHAIFRNYLTHEIRIIEGLYTVNTIPA